MILCLALAGSVRSEPPGSSAPAPGARPDAGPVLSTSATHRYQLALTRGWRARAVPDGSLAPQAGYAHRTSGADLAISRVDYPNLRAWRTRTFPAYADEIEAGIKAGTSGYKRLDRRSHRLGKVPALDIAFRHRDRDGDRVVLMRLLLFRRYSVTLAVSVPARRYRKHRRALRSVRDSFVPYFGD